jgi:hypothetical protein
MKWKGKVDISVEEMDCLFGWFERFIRLDDELSNKVTQTLKKVKKGLAPADIEESSEDNDSESLDWEDQDPSQEKEADVHDTLNMEDYKTNDPDVEIEKGRVAATELFETWIDGFGDETAEQPPRGEILDKLSRSAKGRWIYKFFVDQKTKGKDTTLIIRDIFDDSISDEVIRSIAGNFTQVSSILFCQLSDFIKYPNPLETEE